MLEIIITVIIVLVVLYSVGVFRKEGKCSHCGVTLKGTDQIIIGTMRNEGGGDILCRNCYARIHPSLTSYAKEYWTYENYKDYLAWEEETREERSGFVPDLTYGFVYELQIDSARGLFTLGSGKNRLVFRFIDLADADMDFNPEKIKEGFLSDKVKGKEFIEIQMERPFVYLKEDLNTASYKLREKGFINKTYEYDLSKEFLEAARKFSVCMYVAEELRNRQGGQSGQDFDQAQFDEVQKALALFMFDRIEDVTEENLKKQRNALIKAFHPDNNENNDAYSQKINAAYDVLKGVIKK